MKPNIFLFLFLFLASSISAQTPGVRGNSIFSYQKGDGQVFWTDAVVHPEGFFTVAGIVLSKGIHYLALARFLPDGNLDCNFQDEGISRLSIPADWEYLIKIIRTPEGRLLVLFNPPQEENALFLARFTEDGFLDPSFGKEGIATVPTGQPGRFMDMLLQEDGKVVVAGFEEDGETGMHTCSVHRLLPDGSLDESFRHTSPPPSPHSFHLMALGSLPEGKTLLAVYCEGALAVGRLMPDGSADPGFGEDGRIMYPLEGFRPYDVQVWPDASWLVLGSGIRTEDGWPIALKCGPDGSPDTGFGKAGVLYMPDGLEVAAAGLLLPDGRWLTAGMAQGEDHVGCFTIRRFWPDGSPDPAFGQGGEVKPCFEKDYYIGSAMFTKALPEGRILSGGTVNYKGAIACLDANGNLVQSFGKDGMNVTVKGGKNPLDVDCYKLLMRQDGGLIAAGTVKKAFDSEMLAVKVQSDGALDTVGTAAVQLPQPITGVDAVLQPDGKLVVGGRVRIKNPDGENIDFAATRLNADGSLDTSFAEKGFITLDRGAFDVLGGMALQPDGRILLAGDMENPETYERELVVYRLLPSGLIDSSFGKDGLCALRHAPDGGFAGVILQPDGKILLLDAHLPWGFDMIRLQSNGRWDRSFGIDGLANGSFPDAPYSLQTLMGAVTPDNHILVAGQMGLQVGIFKFENYGEQDPGFGNNGMVQLELPETVWEMAVLPDGKILLAGSGCTDFAPYNYFFSMRLNPDGTPDQGFGEKGILITELPAFSYLSSLLVMDNGAVILGGRGYASENAVHTDMLLLRYLPELDAGHLCPKHLFPFFDVYPYPIPQGEFSLAYDIPERSEIKISLHALNGGLLAELLNLCRIEGKHSESLVFPPGLPEGQYLLKIKTENAESTIRIIHGETGATP
jgi:uncharacterized delta-60 repeat protein